SNRLTLQEVNYVIKTVQAGVHDALPGMARETVLVTARGKQIKPKTLGQQQYIKTMREHDLIFAIGPAGTGKTYLAVAMAIHALRDKQVNRLILTRPAVEAGEKLGFLPGDLQEKVDPYLRPLYDSLYDILGMENTQKYVERHIIEIAPLAYMRGRTLEDAFIILDEAQNTTCEQMKMFLTRLGVGSRAVITGDITQIDLPKGQISGLVHAQKILARVEGIAFHYLGGEDIVRHPLVQDIVRAYDEGQYDEG
ncbi:MAG TPA: phosphate starvation-inducible protein PhoH, partial [Desulfotomaculum sp.]|nr:phosphate starvation-inducible protein PhoH [Desulfotomaculum sp.]